MVWVERVFVLYDAPLRGAFWESLQLVCCVLFQVDEVYSYRVRKSAASGK